MTRKDEKELWRALRAFLKARNDADRDKWSFNTWDAYDELEKLLAAFLGDGEELDG